MLIQKKQVKVRGEQHEEKVPTWDSSDVTVNNDGSVTISHDAIKTVSQHLSTKSNLLVDLLNYATDLKIRAKVRAKFNQPDNRVLRQAQAVKYLCRDAHENLREQWENLQEAAMTGGADEKREYTKFLDEVYDECVKGND